MKINVKIRILEKANELVNSIACGSKLTARCKPHLKKMTSISMLDLRKKSAVLLEKLKRKDTSSIILMKEFKITNSVTTDKHFTKLGFKKLLR